MRQAPPLNLPDNVRRVRLRGAMARLMRDERSPECAVSGPYGTGKTRGILEYLHSLLLDTPNMRALILRKTLTSLTSSALVTFREQVVQPGEARFFGGSKDRPPAYEYANGAALSVGGMDRPDKVLSTEYDVIYVPECRELTEEEWETLSGRLRHGVLAYQQLVGDCNPAGPNHWLKRREARGQLTMLHTRLEDNPAYWQDGDWTEPGAAYRNRLDASLTGVRRARYLEGRWVAAEGTIYEAWDETVHIINRREVPGLVDGQFPGVWPRYWAIDFGYTNPFVWQEWITDPDGRLYLTREIYQTQQLVEDMAHQIRGMVDQWPAAIICDHDAEDRATFAKHLQCECPGVTASKITRTTMAAFKAVSPGLQAVESRLRRAGDGKPRLFLLTDAPVVCDAALLEAGKPTRTADEWDGYVWQTAGGQRSGEAPVKENDHGLDATRYIVAHVDHIDRSSTGASQVIDGRTGLPRVAAPDRIVTGRRTR